MYALRAYCHHGLTLLQPGDIVCSAIVYYHKNGKDGTAAHVKRMYPLPVFFSHQFYSNQSGKAHYLKERFTKSDGIYLSKKKGLDVFNHDREKDCITYMYNVF